MKSPPIYGDERSITMKEDYNLKIIVENFVNTK